MIPGLPPLKVLERRVVGVGGVTTLRLPETGTISASGNKHIVVLANGRTNRSGYSNDNDRFYFNGDTGTNYNFQMLYITGSSTAGGWNDTGHTSLYGMPFAAVNAPSGACGGGSFLLPNAFGDTFKPMLSFGGTHEHLFDMTGGHWASTDAITYITAKPDSGTHFLEGSTFTLAVVDEAYLIAGGDQLTGDQAGFTFASLPEPAGDLGNLSIIASLRGDYSGAAEINNKIELNGDTTTTNYERGRLLGLGGSSAVASADSSNRIGSSPHDATAGVFGGQLISISQYDGTTGDSHMLALSGSQAGSVVWFGSQAWDNTAAITSVKLLAADGAANYVDGSMCSIYSNPKQVLDRKTLTGTTASVTFTLGDLSIPAAVKDLRINVYGRSSHTADYDQVDMEFNGDTTSANYDEELMYGAGSGANAYTTAADKYSGSVAAGGNAGAGSFSGCSILINDYAGTTFHGQNQVLTGADGDGQILSMHSQRWENTAAITSILLTPRNGSWLAGSIIELEGVGTVDPGWTGTVNGIDNPGKVNGIDVANIEKIMGVESA